MKCVLNVEDSDRPLGWMIYEDDVCLLNLTNALFFQSSDTLFQHFPLLKCPQLIHLYSLQVIIHNSSFINSERSITYLLSPHS